MMFFYLYIGDNDWLAVAKVSRIDRVGIRPQAGFAGSGRYFRPYKCRIMIVLPVYPSISGGDHFMVDLIIASSGTAEDSAISVFAKRRNKNLLTQNLPG